MRVEYKKFGKQFRCMRCLCLCDSENDVIEHLEYLHGVICDEERHKNIPYKNMTEEDSEIFLHHYQGKKREKKKWGSFSKRIPPLEDRIMIGEMKIKGKEFPIEVRYVYDEKAGKYKIHTDALKYGDDLEIIYSDESGCFTIKGLKRLREKWNRENQDVSISVGKDAKCFTEMVI